ncbi:MAG: LTA synthase family protein [Oscillospiraceae bacterium]
MKTFFKKVGSFFRGIGQKARHLFGKIPTPKFVVRIKESPKTEKFFAFINKYSLVEHVFLSLIMCFVLEWMSRHSFLEAMGFVVNHTGAYLYNSYLIFVVYSLVYLSNRQTFTRMIISAVFVALGITNCIILLNRVSPFGFTDMNMIGDLLTMQGTSYFTAQQAALAVAAILIYAILMVILFIKGKKQRTRIPYPLKYLFIIACLVSVPFVTKGLQNTGVISAYFGNLSQGYLDNGYIYGFGTSMLGRGMSRPLGYNEKNVQDLVEETSQETSTIAEDERPNIVVVLLESFFDVAEADFIHTSQDPTPYFHYLEDNYSTGHLTVPVVGAGTCNSEFEVLTGMSCQFFGPGEYPQKTILKQTDCESYADDLRNLGYGSHVVHNNGGNFYSRANAFSMMGFDTFQSKEMLDITDYTPLGSWPTDDILVGATIDAMASTDTPDFIYTITVETHGNYPTEDILGDTAAIDVTCDGKTEELTNQWKYYINMLYNMDDFMREYTEALDATGEPTLVIFFGDHLPTMGLTEDEVATHDLFQTKYVTWNNFGMSKEDMDLTTYQLVAEYLDRLGIHEGTMGHYHQYEMDQGVKAGSLEYMHGLELLQYDLLYGKRYAYNGVDLYPATDLEMGVKDVVIDRAYYFNNRLYIYGDNFTKWSDIYVNGEKISTRYESGQVLSTSASNVKDGDTIVVNQVGSSDTIFRSSNEYTVHDPNAVQAEGDEASGDSES